MSTLADLKVVVARRLRDPDAKVFDANDLTDFINDGLTEVGRIMPARFQEDVDPSATALTYSLQASIFGRDVPEIEVQRAELWDGGTPPVFKDVLARRGMDRGTVPTDGWFMWNGKFCITNKQLTAAMNPDTQIIRVWGYSPYAPLTSDTDVLGCSNEGERALLVYARLSGLERLNASRALFTQWQTRAGNSDISPAGLMNALTQAQEDWRRREHKLFVLRETG